MRSKMRYSLSTDPTQWNIRDRRLRVQMKYNKLEALWSSDNPSDILKFYGLVPDTETLVQFASRRPSAEIALHEYRMGRGGDVVTVVPTASVSGALGRNAISLFSPLPLIAAESRGVFFNYARSINQAVSRALDLGFKWIVISNDDESGYNVANSLVAEIDKHRTAGCILASPKGGLWGGRSLPHEIVESSITWDLLNHLLSAFRHHQLPPRRVFAPLFFHKFNVNHRLRSVHLTRTKNVPISMDYFAHQIYEGPYHWVRSRVGPLYNVGDFCVLSRQTAIHYKFDENYINGAEDLDLSLRMYMDGIDVRISDFEITTLRGRSLSNNARKAECRNLRDIYNVIYFFYKHNPGLNKVNFPPQAFSI